MKPRIPVLMVCSAHEDDAPISKIKRRQVWFDFLAGGVVSGPLAGSIPFIIRRCEMRGIGYRLTALPGRQYIIEPVSKTND